MKGTTKKINIALCDDHQVVLQGLNQILASENAFEIVGLFGNGSELLSFLSQYNSQNEPQVIVVDAQLKHESGFELASQIRKLGVYKIILFSSFVDEYMILKAKNVGINACISKDIASDQLIKIIKNPSLDFVSYPKLEGSNNNIKFEELISAIDLLTKRELELVKVLVSGKLSRDLADELNISVYTLETHKKNIFRKLEINSIGELIHLAHKSRLVS